MWKRLKPKIASETQVTFSGVYKTFEDAKRGCGNLPDYDSPAVLKHYDRRYAEVMADPMGEARKAGTMLLPNLTAVAMAEPIDDVIEVLDFGGGYAPLPHLLASMLPGRKLRWTIVEVPTVVQAAERYGASADKIFTTEIPDCCFSLMIVSGTLQSLPDPQATWDKLCAVDVPLALVGRFPLAPMLDVDHCHIQHATLSGQELAFPAWLFSPAWRERIAQFGSILTEFNTVESGEIERVQVERRGYLLRRS